MEEKSVHLYFYSSFSYSFIIARTLLVSQWGGYFTVCVFAFWPRIFICCKQIWPVVLRNLTQILVTDAAAELETKIHLPSVLMEMEAGTSYVPVCPEAFLWVIAFLKNCLWRKCLCIQILILNLALYFHRGKHIGTWPNRFSLKIPSI